MSDNINDLSARILSDADLCVKCGLCLPHCPTYAIRRSEADSPRGRIALAQALASGAIGISDPAFDHLSACLGCRACEKVCPSNVPYGSIIDGVREVIGEAAPEDRVSRLMKRLSDTIVKGSGPVSLLLAALRSGLLRRLFQAGMSLLPGSFSRLRFFLGSMGGDTREPSSGNYPVAGEELAHVALFKGCIARVTDAGSLNDVIRVMNAAGIRVSVPAAQGCCGALAAHGGDKETARRQARENIQAFGELSMDALITQASGCGAMLGEYVEAGLAEGQLSSGAAKMAGKLHDVSDWLMHSGAIERLQLKPLKARVAVHEPCSLRNVMEQSGSVAGMLRYIPELEVMELPGNNNCCGAGGTQLLTHGDTADRLATEKLQALASLSVDYLVTSNTGCGLHLAAAARRQHNDVQVIHPVSLLAQQLGEKHVQS